MTENFYVETHRALAVLRTQLTLLSERLSALEDKLDKDQGAENAGMVLMVGDDGIVAPTELPSAEGEEF